MAAGYAQKSQPRHLGVELGQKIEIDKLPSPHSQTKPDAHSGKRSGSSAFARARRFVSAVES